MNSSSIRAAAVQLTAGEDKAANLAAAQQRIDAAASAGAQWVVLPELFLCLGRPEIMLQQAEDIPGPASDALCEQARRRGILLVAGSFCQRGAPDGKAYNTSLVIGPDGEIIAQYRKMHLFNLDVPGGPTICESNWLAAGDAPLVVELDDARLGMAICYDLRFSGLFAALADARADVIAVPAAFTRTTGQDHWDLLVRLRAVETQSFVVAANQVGRHGKDLVSYGGSAIVDPWGKVLARADDESPFVVAELDFQWLREVRRRLPALENRREIPEARVVTRRARADA